MGGYRNGTWRWRRSKTMVEDCRFLDACRWMRETILEEGAFRSAWWRWWDAGALLDWVRSQHDGLILPDDPSAELSVPSGESMAYTVALQRTRPQFGVGDGGSFVHPRFIGQRTSKISSNL